MIKDQYIFQKINEGSINVFFSLNVAKLVSFEI